MGRRIEATAANEDLADDYAPAVWDEWNAKTPEARAADALTADRAFIATVDGLSAEDQARLTFTMGPMQLDLEGLLGLRLNEPRSTPGTSKSRSIRRRRSRPSRRSR